ncbi:MAG: hypothetical protein CMF45_03570 [Legionellales bacterium]|nr:hypothetical protein [Legionellales bacterium]|tara:strand:- start:410 stop:715 length:306 start_codon:yes stop_codon:yes gene_type:complete
MKKILVILLLAGCDNSDSRWSYEARKGVIDECVESSKLDRVMKNMLGVEEYCDCSTYELMKKYSEQQMKEVAITRNGVLSKEMMHAMVDAASECVHHLKQK